MCWWQNAVIMLISGKCAWSTFLQYVFYMHYATGWFSLWNIHKMLHYVVPQKICSERNMIFLDDWSFLKRSVHCPFFLVGLAIFCRPVDTFHVELVCASAHIFICTLNFTIIRTMLFSNRMHDCMINLIGRSRVRTPGLAHNLFCRSRVRFPGLAALSFCGSRVRFPDPIACFGPLVSMAYVTCPHKWSIR